MEIVTERCAHRAHEQRIELILSQGVDLQLDLLLSEHERVAPGFCRALASIERFGSEYHIRRLNKVHVQRMLRWDADTEFLAPLAATCFSASRSGARVTVLAPRGALLSTAEFTSGATFTPAYVSGERDGNVQSALIIDGCIESVSEIDRLLRDAAATGKLSLIACRSMSPDVKRTIAVNVASGNLRIAALEFPLVDANVNLLGDSCAALGARFHDAVSSGYAWIAAGFDDVSEAAATLRDGTLFVRKPRSHVEARRAAAIAALSSANDPVAIELAQRRLACLGSSVTITLADNHMQPARAKLLVMMLLILDDAAKHGIIETPDGAVHPAGAYQAAASFRTSLKPFREIASMTALNC
jgi:hypothetical protein